MISTPLALSLSSKVTQVGAIAAFAALLGIAILALLVFSQARELRRLREWAGRAPERAAETEQRVSAQASARAQQPSVAAQTVRPVPRAVPINARPAGATARRPQSQAPPPRRHRRPPARRPSRRPRRQRHPA